MTLAEAAEIYARTTREIAPLEQQRAAAKAKLVEHFRKSKRRSFKNIVYSKTIRRSLDQQKVKQHLGDKLGRFLKESPVESLTVVD